MPQADSNPVYAKNLMILSAVVAGKAVLSVAIFTIVRDIMATDIIASCVLVVAIILLVRGGVLRSSREMEIGDSSHPLEDVVSALKAMAIPLAGCLVCQCSLGIGWAAMLFGRLSVVLQTPESFYCVIVGALLCALCLVAARGHIKSIVNFRYYAILACLLLLVVDWCRSVWRGPGDKHGDSLGFFRVAFIGYSHCRSGRCRSADFLRDGTRRYCLQRTGLVCFWCVSRAVR